MWRKCHSVCNLQNKMFAMMLTWGVNSHILRCFLYWQTEDVERRTIQHRGSWEGSGYGVLHFDTLLQSFKSARHRNGRPWRGRRSQDLTDSKFQIKNFENKAIQLNFVTIEFIVRVWNLIKNCHFPNLVWTWEFNTVCCLFGLGEWRDETASFCWTLGKNRWEQA